MPNTEYPSPFFIVPSDFNDAFTVGLNSSSAVDISDHLDSEQTLLRVNAQLNRRISEYALELRSLRKQVLEVAAEEDRRLGFELHDNIQQQLAGLGMLAQCLAERLACRSSSEAESSRQLALGIGETATEVHRLARGLIPLDIDADGLQAALSDLSIKVHTQHGIVCRFRFSDNTEIASSFVATHLYRITQEAVNNAIKHGHASQIDIFLIDDQSSLALTVQDNGCGIDPSQDLTVGMGLRTMQHRAELINASMCWKRGKEQGTVVTCIVASESAE